MIIKFFNGHMDVLPSIDKDSIFSDKNYIEIYNYIINNREKIGIDTDYLMFYEQINFFIENENEHEDKSASDENTNDIDNDIVLCVFIEILDSFDFCLVSSWIECIPVYERKEKVEKYIQYLADRSLILLSSTKKYCEIWVKDIKISSVWSEYILSLPGFSCTKQDNGLYLCENIPLSIGKESYCITAIFKEQDLD